MQHTSVKKMRNCFTSQPCACWPDYQFFNDASDSLADEFNVYRPGASSITLHRIRTSPGLSEKSINSAEHRHRDGRSLRTSPATADQGLQQCCEKKRLASCTKLSRWTEYSCRKKGCAFLRIRISHNPDPAVVCDFFAFFEYPTFIFLAILICIDYIY